MVSKISGERFDSWLLGLSSRWFHHVEWVVCVFFFERGLICFCISKKGVEYVQRDLQELKAQKKSGSFRCLCCACIIVDTLFSDMLNVFLPHFCMRLS